jgi:hypothetical protein
MNPIDRIAQESRQLIDDRATWTGGVVCALQAKLREAIAEGQRLQKLVDEYKGRW